MTTKCELRPQKPSALLAFVAWCGTVRSIVCAQLLQLLISRSEPILSRMPSVPPTFTEQLL